jgi:Zn-dependent protease
MLGINLEGLILSLPWIVFGFVFHEFCHAWMSERLGDPMPRREGRVSLSPVKHIDLFGIIALIIFRFGWAKPVQINPRFYKNPMRDTVWVALAGPAGNFMLAIFNVIVLRLLIMFDIHFYYNGMNVLFECFGMGLYIMLSLCVFNLIPIPPLDGSKVLRYFLKGSVGYQFDRLESYGIFIVMVLVFVGGFTGVFYQFLSIISNLLVGRQIF